MTDFASLALGLADQGFFVFPVAHTTRNEKKPYTSRGHLDATQDPGVIIDWWQRWPDAKVGVAAGPSGIVVADVDTKNGKDGWDSLDKEWLELPPTFSYETGTGGTHLVYSAPNGVELNGQSDYRGMVGVDRRGGSSWVLWVGGVPSKEDISAAPEWLCDPAEARKQFTFEGDLKDWFESLVPGDPNALVRRAIEKINPDMTHSEMVAAQHAAIRLGAEGNPGVPVLLDALRSAWESRPAENHSTPEQVWGYKWEEAFVSGLQKFGETTDLLKNLPEYSIALVPASIPDTLVTGENTGKTGFSRLLNLLVKETDTDERIASILWNCPATRDTARDWGLEFVYRRITEARVKPEPTRENPKIEAKRELEVAESHSVSLLSDEERAYIAKRPTFVQYYVEAMGSTGFVNEKYARAAAWTVASMAFSFHGFIPVTPTDKMGLNLWNMVLGYSGTGKSRHLKFRDECLRLLFNGDNADGAPFDLGADSSPQGLHMALLQRDRKASFFGTDEASGFFKQLNKTDWMSSLDDTLSDWYEGYVRPSSKISLKELRGKSAMTSLVIQMFATPDRLTGVLNRDMFLTGFLARFNWVVGDPPIETDDRFQLLQSADVEDFESAPDVIKDVVANLVEARVFAEKNPAPLLATDEALQRMSEAYKRMYNLAKARENWDITEPSVTRLMEAMRKCAGICAVYRSDRTINIDDALHAIAAVEEWFENLFVVADMISAGDFQRDCNAIEAWIRRKGGSATKAQVYHTFRNMVVKDGRELDARINFLVESGSINREEISGGSIRYQVNGGV